MDKPNPSFGAPSPPPSLLEAMYHNLPMVVVAMTTDGVVLYCNSAAVQVTGFSESELVGKNFWALLFPGRLFAQVPRFISAIHPAQVLGKDAAMTIRTRDGKERIVAWSRLVYEATNGQTKRTIVCFGTDLTDRLLESDLPHTHAGADDESFVPFGPTTGNAGVIEGDIVEPIAISPPILPTGNKPSGGAAIQQVHEFLTGIDTRMEALTAAFSNGEMEHLSQIAEGLRDGAHACGLLGFSTRAEQLHRAVENKAFEQVDNLMHQIVTMCRPGEKGKSPW